MGDYVGLPRQACFVICLRIVFFESWEAIFDMTPGSTEHERAYAAASHA